MSLPRPLSDIQAEIAATACRLAELERERARTRARCRSGIVVDFDAGLSRAEIAARWGVDYGYVSAVLHQAGRPLETRRRASLSPCQRPHYDRLLELGVRGPLAHVIARAVAP